MSTVDYTRYTRIIHCRPCYNVYVISKCIKVFAAVVRPDLSEWVRQCSRVGFESIFSGLGLDYITGISITPSDPLCFWRGALRSGRREGRGSNVPQQRFYLPNSITVVPTKSGQAPTNNARILHVSSCHVFVSPALPATGALSGVNNSTLV